MVSKNGKYAWTTKVSDKGQIVIPKEAREVFDIKLGDTLILLGDVERGIALVKSEDYVDLANAMFGAKKGENNDRN